MSAVFSGNTPGASGQCIDFDLNAATLNTALEDANIVNNGLLELTRIDGSVYTNNIPYFSDFVITGLTLNISNVPVNRTLTYTAGTYQINAQVYNIPLGANFQLTAGHPTLPRIDILYLTNTNNIFYQTGTPSTTPVQPTPPAGTLLLAAIGVQINATTSLNYTLVTVNTNSTTIVPTTIANGTVTGSHLYWDGISWIENTFWNVSDSSFDSTARIHTYTDTDAGGIVTTAKLGDSLNERGFYFLVDDALNGYTIGIDLTSNIGSAPYFQVSGSDSNLFATARINITTDGNDIRSSNITNDRQSEFTQTDSNNILEINLSTKDPLNRNEFTQTLTQTNSSIRSGSNISGLSQTINDFTFNTTDTTQVNTEFVIGNVPIAGENGFQFRVNDVLGSNDLYMLLTAQDSVNNKTTFKVNQLDSASSDFSSIELSSKKNQFNLLDGATNAFFETIQTLSNGVVNRAVNATGDSFVKVQPTQINLDSYNVATPTTYTSLIQTSTGFQLYSNNSNVNLISNIVTSNGLINFNGGISERYVNTAVNRAVVTNDYIIVATAAPLTITLPAIPVDGRKLIIISNGVATGGNQITINGNGKNINGAANAFITTAYGTTTLHYNNSLNKWLIIV